MTECFIGRQPILDRSNEVYAYELLYRDSLDNAIGNVDRTVATSRVVLNAFVDIGLEKLVGRHRAFIHVSEDFLVSPDLTAFPSDRVALQISDPIGSTPAIVDALSRLREDGHRVVLNGYRSELPLSGLLPLADIVKIDAIDLDNEAVRREMEILGAAGVTVVAKRVETMERRNELAALGVDCFQGHFLAHPEVVTGSRLPTNQLAVLQLVGKLSNPGLETSELEQLISTDPALSLRVLRFVNSPMSGLTREIESVHHAVVLVGREIIRNWVMLLAVASLDNSVPELVKATLIRARVCEQLAIEARLPGKESFFTVGLFSLMDALMARPMDELLDGLPLKAELKAALADQSGVHGEAVRCAAKLEHGAPDGASFQGVTSDRIAEVYLDALLWADATASAVR